MPELRRFAPNVPIVLVGTKLDLHEDKGYLVDHPGATTITAAQGEELRKQIGAAVYIECSSKTQQNVKVVFDTAIKVVLQPPRRKEVPKKKRKRMQLSSHYCIRQLWHLDPFHRSCYYKLKQQVSTSSKQRSGLWQLLLINLCCHCCFQTPDLIQELVLETLACCPSL
ncbi:hypothetical protein B296_00005413 [Ensete ventricosum]|uniref:Uncharacterized protein n=1 Tax=Ensete ventricosum TaxID=4639 RepID=A0A426YZT5_ENSVE|nr:hypothetical protein B296_00005413 [Ensete ventricosum]